MPNAEPGDALAGEQLDELGAAWPASSSWIPVVSSSSPPESHGVGSSSSEMWTQRISRSAPSSPAASSSPQPVERGSDREHPGSGTSSRSHAARAASVSTGRRIASISSNCSDVADQRRRELDHGVAAVVRAADQPAAVELAGEEAAQQLLGLLVGEALLRVLVLDQLDRVEVAGAANVTDDRDVAQAVEHRPELALACRRRGRRGPRARTRRGWPSPPRRPPGGRRR